MTAVSCTYLKEGIKHSPAFVIDAKMRKQLMAEVGNAATLLFWHLTARRTSTTVPMTDANLSKEMGGTEAGWSERSINNNRRKLTAHHWFDSLSVNDPIKKHKHINYYIGKLAVIKYKTGTCDLPYYVGKNIDTYICKQAGKSNPVEFAEDFIIEKHSIANEIAGWLMKNPNSTVYKCPTYLKIEIKLDKTKKLEEATATKGKK